MTVTREDIQRALDFITTWKLELSMMGKYNDDVKVEPTIRQVLEDRLNQVDYKSLAEEQNKTLLLCKKDYEGIRRACKKYGFENTFKDCGESIEYIDNVISKYEQAIKGEK